MAKNKSRHPRFMTWLIVAGSILVAGVLAFVVWVNTALANGRHNYDSKSAYLYQYELSQTPDRPVAGRPVVFQFRVIKEGQPLPNQKVKVGISHSYGLFIEDRAEDVVEKELVTDADGLVTFTKTFTFNSLQSDAGFGVHISPILSPQEKSALLDKIGSHEVPATTNTAATFSIPVVYPKWMNWFLWR